MTKHFIALILVITVIFSGCAPRKTEVATVKAEPQVSDIEPLRMPSPTLTSIKKTCWRETEQRFIHAGLTDRICNYCGEYVEPRYGFTNEEVYILAQLLCGDESYDGDGEYDFVYGALHNEMNYCEMSKILCVVMNRVRDEAFPDTISKVIFEEGQFAGYSRTDTEPSDIAIAKIQQWCESYDRWDPCVQSIPESHLYYEAGPDLTNITGESW